jgi:hypothetical protein
MPKHATITIHEGEKYATLEMPGMKATDPFYVHDDSRTATILYLFKLATQNGATDVSKVSVA